MVNRPSVPEIITVNSEALQATVRNLLPSQNGFGSELQASNIITPVIDLTPSAEGTVLRQDLQKALTFGDTSTFAIANNTTTLTTVGGFWRVTGTISLNPTAGADANGSLIVTRNATDKALWSVNSALSGAQSQWTVSMDEIFFIAAGDTLKATCNAQAEWSGSYRQVASVTGELTAPQGFTAE